ncbi:hypothetical protein ACF07F_16530 [Streptomyces sp. NPDC015237]|uniref:hypothetical protein n=1 Tax=Streptomyces sp. NPDC015237 TaxID=3364949 RepID=UPI0036FFC08E
MTERKPITPTRIIPAGETLPAPVSPPPPPPVPPAPPTAPDPGPDWWRGGSGPSGPAGPVEIHHHYYPAEPAGGPLSVPDPEPGPRWYQRIRWGYNAALAVLSLSLAGPWGAVLASVRDEASLAGAWVMALVPLTVLAFLDNARRIEALHADPDLWAPKWRAALMRFLLWAAVLGTVLTLPLTTLVYALTGVKPA